MMLLVPRMQGVSFPLAVGTGNATKFPPTDNLNGENVKIIGFTAFSAAQFLTTLGGGTVISAADALEVVVNFNNGSDILFMEIPYTDLIRQLNSGMYVAVEPFRMAMEKSTVVVTKAAGITAGSNAAFNMFYQLIDK